ncbi:uncharacterized protein cubi_02185 [Cryptosporidium ubiquitum]|uniref:Vacuolar membrane-associated protein Iml1 N-terminal domain-containing protein n=1 Tax=Cryptosporidium ubiquitum TaxID=857276 RepID=A0A1J4MFC0_9CRYT|nr:uncharacterized protein cubi_02185 [Cryptosporidium ubiquitum]OII72954.1 hypothetical protein cubi_02185 [Cryptosporidium ubiquitum]
MKKSNEIYKEKDMDGKILVPLSFHNSKKNSFPILISHELSERLIKKYGSEDNYFEIVSSLNPENDIIHFQLNCKSITENLNVGVISVLDYLVKSSGIPLIRQEVEIRKVNSKKDMKLKIVELSLPEIHISPRDLWYYEKSLIDKILYNGISPQISFEINQYLPISITRMGNENDDNNNKKTIISGLVTDDTKFIIRPRSVRIIMVVVISKEFFCFSSNGFPWWRGIISFFKEYLTSNKQLIEHHYITILLTWKAVKEKKSMDYYQVFWEGVLSQITLSQTNINKLIEKLRRIIISFQKDQNFIKTLVSYYESNILESINFALTQLQNDLIDGSLVWTGRNIKVLSSGPPIIIGDLQNYQRLLNLSKITEVRFLKTSITCDFISFSELNWYHSLNIYIVKIKNNLYQETLKVINLRLSMNILYYKIKNKFYNDYNGKFNLSSTITLLDEYINDQINSIEDKNQEKEEEDDDQGDIDLIISGKDMVVRNISGLVDKRESLECNVYDSDNISRNLSINKKSKEFHYINENESFNCLLGTFLLPLTTINLNKIDIKNNISNSKDLTINEIQRTSNWTLTPRKELFLAYIWKNYQVNNPRLIKHDFNELSVYIDKSEYKDINIEILRLIYYDLIVHRMSMSFQISTLKSNNITTHYNSENIQMLKYYNSSSNNITLNYNCIHQLNLLKDDNNILVEVIDAIIQDNSNTNSNTTGLNTNTSSCFRNDNLSSSFNSNTNNNDTEVKNIDENKISISLNEENDSVNFYTFLPKSMNSSEIMEIDANKLKNVIINYKYEYFLYRSKYDNCCEISPKSTKGEYIKYYTIFNNLSNVNFSTLDEILVWQREVPFINELINESFNELLNYYFEKNNLDYYYLLTSYISGLSISYIHFAFIPYVKISDSSTNSNTIYTNKIEETRNVTDDFLKFDEIDKFDYLDCYSNYYKDCCLESILNNWIKINSVNNNQLKEMVDYNIGNISDECLNMKNLKRISEMNIKSLIKSLQSFFFKNAPSEINHSFDIEIMNDHNYYKNERKSVKILYSWCESFEFIKEEYESELKEKYKINFNSNSCNLNNNSNHRNNTNTTINTYNHIKNSNKFEPINWFVIYYDSIWYPLLPFKFSIGWLTCPSLVISRIVRKLKSILLNYYFTLIQLRSSDVYSSYEISPDNSILSSYTPLNPPYLIKFKASISNSIIKLLLKHFISSPLSLQLLFFDQSNSISRFFLVEPHSIYTLELNENALLLRINYYQYFWKNQFQYDSFPIFKCPCSSLMFDYKWRNNIFYFHINYIKKIVKTMQI